MMSSLSANSVLPVVDSLSAVAYNNVVFCNSVTIQKSFIRQSSLFLEGSILSG